MRAEVAELNARFGGWAFAIPEYKGDVLARRMRDLVAEETEDEAQEPLESGQALDLDSLVEPSPVPSGDEQTPTEMPVDEGGEEAGEDAPADPGAGDAPPEETGGETVEEPGNAGGA